MNATIPWWGSGLFTVVGAAVTSMITLVLGLLNRRSERRRLSRERKVADYPELVSAASTLAELPVWPAESADPRAQYDELHSLAQRIAFFSPQKVTGTLPELLNAGDHLVKAITDIRADSRPVHGNNVDQRYAERHGAAVNRLDEAINAFATAARTDLEIKTPYTLVRADRSWSAPAAKKRPSASTKSPK
ncbi:hypothetical protein [Saccharopolyspora sp. 5N708]|uniref:hypothetical protein n=1 Tax=Saccharopolyspora sp. 5N708 TaxID=3457424 RepID=UPI003FD3BA80